MWQEMRKLAENKSKDLTLHFVYAGNNFWGDGLSMDYRLFGWE